MKSHPIRLTDNYGNAARGQIRTATTVNSGTLDKAVTGLIGLNIIGNILNSPSAHNAADALANGRYDEAALSAAAALDAISGIGSGVNALMDTYRQAQDAKAQQAIANAAAAAQTNAEAAAAGKVFYAVLDTKTDPGYANEKGAPVIGGYWAAKGSPFNRGSVPANGKPFYTFTQPLPNRPLGNGQYDTVWIQPMQPGYVPPPPSQVSDIMLTADEITQILLQQLHDNNSALNQNTQALTDLLNALVAGGHLDPSKQPTQVLGSPAENTFVTPPFTPAGSDTAQQTQFIVNPDGSVTVSQIQRPDLSANTSQAPTRSEVGQAAPSPAETREAKQGSTAEKPDICAQNPNSLMCADLGSGDYTDPVLPNEQRSLDFNPADLFADTGTCPAPKQISVFTANIKLPYDPLCDMAGKLRPLIILLGMSTALFMVYGAVNNE